MAMTKQEAAYLAASRISTQRVTAIANDFVDWIDDQVTEATAVLALVAASGSSKSPEVIKGNAATYYELLENDPATIDAITPNTGPAAGGTTVTITGTNLTEVSSVTFGGTPGTSLTHVDDGELTVVTPAKSAGAYNVVAVHAAGNATVTNGFTYS